MCSVQWAKECDAYNHLLHDLQQHFGDDTEAQAFFYIHQTTAITRNAQAKMKQYHPLKAVAIADAAAPATFESTLLGGRHDGIYPKSCECGPIQQTHTSR